MKLWEAFDYYVKSKKPSDTHRSEVRRYRERLHALLVTEYRLVGFFQSGSFQHGTAVMPYSDVDYIARINYEDKPQSSTAILNNIRNYLKSELWEASDIFVSRPTVTVRFPSILPDYEITPAYLLRGSSDEDRVVEIPAANGGWREAAPQAHNKFVARMDSEHYGDVRELAVLLKSWKYETGAPISSFYLEMRAAEYGKNNDSIWTLSAVRDIVKKLIDTSLPQMNDPTGLVSRISPCSSEVNRAKSLALLRAMRGNLDAAYSCYFSDSSNRWNLNQALQAIWGSSFPYCDTHSD